MINARGGTSHPLFVLIQGLTGLSHPSDEVCEAVSSMAARGEVRTDYKVASNHQTAWNHVLVLDILREPQDTVPHAGILLQVSVLSPTIASGHELMASGACLCPSELADGGFCNGRLCLRDAKYVASTRLQLAMSWSKADIMMLHRGLLPQTRFISFKEAPAHCSAHDSKALVRSAGLDDLHRIGPDDEADALPDLEAGAKEDGNVDAFDDVASLLGSSIKGLPTLAQVVVRSQSPYRVTSVKFAQTACRVLRRPPEVGQSIAALGLGRTRELIDACSHVAACSSREVRKRAFLYFENSLLVVQDLPEDEQNLAQLKGRLEVLLLSVEGQDRRYRQLVGNQTFLLQTQSHVSHRPIQSSSGLVFGSLMRRDDVDYKNKFAGAHEKMPKCVSVDELDASHSFPHRHFAYHMTSEPCAMTNSAVPHRQSDTEDKSDTEDLGDTEYDD